MSIGKKVISSPECGLVDPDGAASFGAKSVRVLASKVSREV